VVAKALRSRNGFAGAKPCTGCKKMTLLTKQEINDYMSVVDKVPIAEQKKIAALLEMDRVERCKDSFLFFVGQMWPVFISGKHHQIMADAFERVADGSLKRLIINMAPRHTKSEFASYLLPSWFLGKFPEKKIIQTAHTAELAVGFGRKVRNLVSSDNFSKVFDTKLSSDSKAAGRWNTNKGGDYFAIGVGGAVTGKGADLLIIDDPHSEQEAKQGNPAVYDNVYEWYTSGPRQRLQPGGAIIIVMCMTGDTKVQMADGTSTQLKDLRPGDMVATFDRGRLATAKVNNWQSSGVDSIYEIQTQSGIILRANEIHPFLVLNEGVLEWTRLQDLKPGMLLVATKDAVDLRGRKLNPENAQLAKLVPATTEKTLMPLTYQSGITESGKGKNARVESQLKQKGCAIHATPNNSHQQSLPLNKTELDVSNTDTVSPSRRISKWLQSVITDVMFVGNNLLRKTQGRTGAGNSALTTATAQEKFEDCFVTTAILQSGTERQQAFSNELRRISDFIVDQIVSITPDGEEEVFDVEVDRTENFIANGVVSHNTRWSKKDLTGQIIKNAEKSGVDDWEVIEFPAIMPSGTPIWPAFWSKKELEAIKAEIPVSKWEAQYQQNPTSEEGAIIKRNMWSIWEKEDPPECEYVIQSWDTAFEKSNRADYSACTTWGVFYKLDKDGKQAPNIICLDAFKRRLEFPELKEKALELWKEWNPDSLIIEKKAAGAPLIYELRKIGIPLSEYTPGKGHDKIARVNSISDLFASGIVWCPDTRWADELMDEMASFPNGDNDDLVDSTSQALIRFRQGGFISIDSDEKDEYEFRRKVEFY
jgi:predicted phage terminase large subunit-like protein